MQHVLVPGRGRPPIDGDSLDESAPLVWTIPGVMSPAECIDAIARIEQLGPTAAPVSTPHGMRMMPDVRNNERVMFDDGALAERLFARIRDAVPPVLFGMRAVGANERFRCYRYTPGQLFAPHYDGSYQRNSHESSLLTLIVYLNDDFDGGRTASSTTTSRPSRRLAPPSCSSTCSCTRGVWCGPGSSTRCAPT